MIDIWIVYILFYNDESKKSPEEEWVLSQLNKIHKPTVYVKRTILCQIISLYVASAYNLAVLIF